jgi:hypothetical protein
MTKKEIKNYFLFQLKSLTNVGGTPGTAAVNAGILNSILAVSNPTCEA